MTENRFFTWVWRFNGLMIAVTVTLILFVIVWQLTRDLRRTYFPDRTTEVITVAPAAGTTSPREVIQTTRLGAPQDTAAPGIYALPQFAEQTYTNRGISKESGGNRVNYLVVDTAAQSTRWLFAGTARLITDVRPLWHTPSDGNRRLLGHVLHVIEDDTSGEGQLTRRDGGPLYYVDPDWGQARAITGPVRDILSIRAQTANSFEVIHTDGINTILGRYSLPDGMATLEMTLQPRD